MAPRAPKPKAVTDEPLKPKTEKSKVVKPKTVQPDKTEKAKAEKKEKEKTEKVKPATGDEAIHLIAEYLKAQNRPYSATEVSANLHGKVTKTVADKLLKEMEQSKQIMGKATNGDKKGSQWVFWALQDPNDAATPEELATMDETITALRARLPGLRAAVKAAGARLASVAAGPTAGELEVMVERLRGENGRKRERVEGVRSGEVRMVSREEAERVEREVRHWGARRTVRKRAFDAVEDLFLVAMTREELWEKAGVEGEE